MLHEIKSTYDVRILFSLDCDSLTLCVEAAVKAGADLRGAYLGDANLRGANLRGAYLGGANLRGAHLRGADLGDAHLGDAYLGGADLGDANLRGAYLRGAYLGDANLRGADLGGANLRGAYLRGADLRGADLGGADLGAVKESTSEQAIANLDKVRSIILESQELLRMSRWHESEEWVNRTCAEEVTCGTTHCLAGWLQVCSTDPAIRKLQANIAGILLAPVASKMFYKTDDEVLRWLEKREYAREKS